MLWASYYIRGEDNKRYFTLLTLLFAVRMFLLLFRESFISLFLGWEGLGITSYLLIGYYQRWDNVNNSIFTYLTIRVGDVFFLLSIFFHPLLFLFLLASTKRAVFPFIAWLPKAIRAPTPIRALVHSSTLVTAGIFFLLKVEINLTPFIFLFLLTLIFSSLLGRVEKDGKKIIALSTLRQLAFILLLMRRGYYLLGIIHLIIHGFFKRLLFLIRGTFIHSRWGEQIKSKIINRIPSVISVYNLTLFRLIGIPYLSGIISKDLFITNLTFFNLLFWLSISLTFLYSLSLIQVPKNINIFTNYHKSIKIYSGVFLFLLAIIIGIILGRLEELVSWEKRLPLLYFLLLLLIVTPFSNYLNFIVSYLKEIGKFFESLLITHLTLTLTPLLFLLYSLPPLV